MASHIPEPLQSMLARPSMYVSKSYDSVCACILGYDLASNELMLSDFTDWMREKNHIDSGLSWKNLHLTIAFQDEDSPIVAGKHPDNFDRAIETLATTLNEFLAHRKSQNIGSS